MVNYRVKITVYEESAGISDIWGMKSIWNQILQYLYIRKRDKSEPLNTNTKLMHGMNRISILMFLIAILILLYRVFFHKSH